MVASLLSATAARALSAPVEVTLRGLLEEYGLSTGDGVLNSLVSLTDSFVTFGLKCDPPIGVLGLDDPRVLGSSQASPDERWASELDKGETAEVEFKSSLILDRRRFLEEPGLPLSQYRLEAVTHSGMKTIAAYTNTNGGVLFFGITDRDGACGLIEDFEIANPRRSDYDGWEQFLRGQVESRFVDGKSVNAYIKTELLSVSGKPVVRTVVTPRRQVTFLKKAGGGCELYVRSGTRSVAVDFHDIEKHYEMRRLF